MRRLVGLFLGLVVVIAAISTVWTYASGEDRQAQLVISEVDGEVRLTVQGVEDDARRGVVLGAKDRLVTGSEARAVLALGANTRIRMGPLSALEVTAVSEEGVQLELEDGALHATVRPEGGAVRVGSQGREVIATNAAFDVGVHGGVLQVSTQRGSVSLAGVDNTRVDAGSQATIVDRKADIGPVPEEVLLEVEWPEPVRTRARTTTIAGTTAPGALVRLVGPTGEPVAVRADAAGRFRVEMPLSEGSNEVEIEAVDVLGKRSRSVEGTLQTRDTLGPSFRGGVKYGD